MKALGGPVYKQISAFVLLFVISALAVTAQTTQPVSHQPLDESTLLALVSGGALPENVAWHIQNDGLSFRPSQPFRTLLQTAGATASVLAAVDSARITANPTTAQPEDLQRLQHLANAGQLIRDKKYDDAARELMAELSSGFDKV